MEATEKSRSELPYQVLTGFLRFNMGWIFRDPNKFEVCGEFLEIIRKADEESPWRHPSATTNELQDHPIGEASSLHRVESFTIEINGSHRGVYTFGLFTPGDTKESQFYAYQRYLNNLAQKLSASNIPRVMGVKSWIRIEKHLSQVGHTSLIRDV